MGYSSCTTAYYGLQLNEAESTLVYPVLRQAVLAAFLAEHGEELDEEGAFEQGPGHPGFWAEDADSRSENLEFEEGYEHGMGIHLAEDEDIVQAIRTLDPAAVARYEAIIAPVIEQLGIDRAPDVHVVQQTI